MGCQHLPSTLSNEHGFRFLAFGPWMRTDNDLSPPGIYEKALKDFGRSTDESFKSPEFNNEGPASPTTDQTTTVPVRVHDEVQVRQSVPSGTDLEDTRMANATPESVSTILHEDSLATKCGSSTHSLMRTVETEILYPNQCQPVKTNSTQTYNLNSSSGLSHQPMASGPIPVNIQIEQNSKPHNQTKASNQSNSSINPNHLEALLSTTIPTDLLNTEPVRRLNVSLGDVLSSSAVAARQSRQCLRALQSWCQAGHWCPESKLEAPRVVWRHVMETRLEVRNMNGLESNWECKELWQWTGWVMEVGWLCFGAVISRRMESWDLLRRLGAESSLPWLVCGDFNEIMDNGEKLGFRSRAQRLMNNFREALTDCGLSDLGFQGPKFTWSNLQSNENVIFARLDRGVSTREWLRLFPATKVRILPFAPSDHHAVIVDYNFEVTQSIRRKHQFKFQAIWVKREGCEEVVRKAWETPQDGTRMFQLCQKIKGCRMVLTQWNKHEILSLPSKIKGLRAKLSNIDNNIHKVWQDHARLTERHATRKELNHFISQEEIYWRQSQDDVWVSNKEELGGLVNHYFQNLFTSSNPSGMGINQVVNLVDLVVIADMNQWLMREFDASEVRQALFQMHPTKAPGPDGISAIFFQTYWHIVGHDFTSAILDFLNSGNMLRCVNFTHIVMIPKTKSPESITQFRPISLCNVIYKTISKVLANRLKVILPSIISESQSAFVPGRLIFDNILVAFESFHYLKNKRRGKTTHMAAKLDMSKAYDRVEWGYLEALMLRLGFNRIWVEIIMKCITTVHYSVLLNGLSALLRRGEADFVFRGVAVCRGGPRVTHLLFADDCLLFFRATTDECLAVMNILGKYEVASGQKLNNDKTSIFFSTNISTESREDIRNLMGASNTNSIEKYLGLPSFVERSKIKAFEDLPTKVWKKLQGWKEKLLSQAGREILIKAVTQVIPVYAMSCFRIPNEICASINSMLSNFWWGQKKNERKMHWKSWHDMCSSKSDGGMGFRNLKFFNLALLAKQCWRLIHHPYSLIGRVFKAKYFPTCSFMDAKIPTHSSFIWRSIAQAREVIVKGSRWCVGDGAAIRIWQDKWIPSSSGHKVISPNNVLQPTARVCELFSPSFSWNNELIEEIFLPFEADSIKKIPLVGVNKPNRLIWAQTPNGIFSVQSAYHMLVEESNNGFQGASSSLWWSSFLEEAVLFDRKMTSNFSCPVCGYEAETIDHTFMNCSVALAVWGKHPNFIALLQSGMCFVDWVEVILSSLSSPDIEIFFTLVWFIWRHRNEVWLGLHPSEVQQISLKASRYALEFLEAVSDPTPSLEAPRSAWTPPSSSHLFKVNVASVLFKERQEVGIGVVVRNSQGVVLAATSEKIRSEGDWLWSSAVSLLKSLKLLLSIGFFTVEIECYNSYLVSLLNSGKDFFTETGWIIEDIRELLPSFYSIVRTTTRGSHGPQNVTQLTMDQPSRFEG
uniref:Reverse transcriptase domain-containing protein n=1 Tax=Fagus sylvatica TaxID=28930 RepID=A0A2N9GCH6_FAGSY